MKVSARWSGIISYLCRVSAAWNSNKWFRKAFLWQDQVCISGFSYQLWKWEILLKMRNTGEKENKITGWKIKRRNKNWRKVLNFITYLLQKLVQQSGNHLEAYIRRHLLWFGTVSFNQRFHAPHHQRGKSPVQCILWPRNSIIKPWKCCEKNKSWRVINSVCFNVFRSIKIIVDTDTVTMWWSDLSNYSCAYVMRKVGPSHCIKSQTYKCRSMGRNILF